MEEPPSSPPPAATPPVVARRATVRNALLAVGAVGLFLTGAIAGYRLYAEQRAELAAESVRIRAFLEAHTQAETPNPVGAVAKTEPPPRVPAAQEGRQSSASVAPVARAKPRPAVRKPGAAKRASLAKRDARAPQRKLAKSQRPARALPVRADAPALATRVDRLYAGRTVRECADGWLGLICREVLRVCICGKHDAWGKASSCPAVVAVPAWPGGVG